MNEFKPIEHFYRLARFWWLIVITCLVGGGIGFAFHGLHAPLYEANATFYVGIDTLALQKLNLPTEQFQYNEEVALYVTQAVLVSPELLSVIAAEASTKDPEIDEMYLMQNSTIERKLTFWELRFRHKDPVTAQMVANLWAENGYQTMLDWLRTGKAPNYVIFTPPTLASLPQAPVIHGRNQLVLAGVLIGFIVGVFLIEVLARFYQ